ncbi:MAG TPA: hypothetical protein V6C69_20520 [Trichormus sp.]|jgi:hypothetical protein
MDGANQNSFKAVDVDMHAPAFEAYSSFKSQFDQLQKCPQLSANQSESGGLGLSDSQLDKLSIVWLAQQNSALGREITRADLDAPQANAFDTLMAEHARTQYEAVRHAHFDPEGGFLLIGSKEKDALTSKDIETSLKTIEKQRQSLDYADPLMSNNGALFYRLSREHDGVRSINYWDLKEARSTDDYEHSIGKSLFTDEERNLIDRMYKGWGRQDMRAIEERPQDSTMGCDGAITAASLAQGTGFQSADEMSHSFNQPRTAATGAENCADKDAERRLAVIQNARQLLSADKDAIHAHSYYSVQPGQGFDRIARNVMANEQGAAPAEGDVVKYSQSIATMNGYDRDNYDAKVRSLQPGQSIQVHDSDWQLQQLLNSIGEVDDYVSDNLKR